jgi:hypothetical protein
MPSQRRKISSCGAENSAKKIAKLLAQSIIQTSHQLN